MSRHITRAVIDLLATSGGFPGLTRMEIRHALDLPADTEIPARVRESRQGRYGSFDVRCHIHEGQYRYWMPVAERERALKLRNSEADAEAAA
jgi:hypothetical protein